MADQSVESSSVLLKSLNDSSTSALACAVVFCVLYAAVLIPAVVMTWTHRARSRLAMPHLMIALFCGEHAINPAARATRSRSLCISGVCIYVRTCFLSRRHLCLAFHWGTTDARSLKSVYSSVCLPCRYMPGAKSFWLTWNACMYESCQCSYVCREQDCPDLPQCAY